MFQSTHPRRVWLVMDKYEFIKWMFQSTHPRRVWPRRFSNSRTWNCFNPHTHEGCDRDRQPVSAPSASFNPHTHEGCDDPFEIEYPRDPSFNPHTHEGCDHAVDKFPKSLRVSIHTPTKGVTKDATGFNCSFCVSIHTPTKGVTHRQLSTSIWRHCFNPHTHEGCDYIKINKDMRTLVSIHTPTKGVT